MSQSPVIRSLRDLFPFQAEAVYSYFRTELFSKTVINNQKNLNWSFKKIGLPYNSFFFYNKLTE